MSKINKESTKKEHELILREAGKIAEALAETFAPLCEVVLHDLQNPQHAVIKVENNLSGRKIGDPATEIGLARIANPNYPDKLINYANKFADGREVKSTSIGLKDSSGTYVAALCLNLDVSYLKTISAYLGKLTEFSEIEGVSEQISPVKQVGLKDTILEFAQLKNKDPAALSSTEKRELLAALKQNGQLELRGAVDTIAKLTGASRSSIYYYIKK